MHGRKPRLELEDVSNGNFEATVLESSREGIDLNKSYFHPVGGGKPADFGAFGLEGNFLWIEGWKKGDNLYLIPVEIVPLPFVGAQVEVIVDDGWRF